MARIVALCDPDLALGFRLAGIEALEAESADDVAVAACRLLGDPEVGIVAVDEELLAALPEPLQRRLETSGRPVVVPLPHVRSWREGERREDYLARLLRRIVGYQVRIAR